MVNIDLVEQVHARDADAKALAHHTRVSAAFLFQNVLFRDHVHVAELKEPVHFLRLLFGHLDVFGVLVVVVLFPPRLPTATHFLSNLIQF